MTPTHPASRTPGSTQRSTRGLRWLRGAVGLLAGCLLVTGCQGGGGEPPAEATSTRPVTDERVEAGRPVSIAIPAAGVDARVVPVGLRSDGAMEVPGVDLAGWYEPGPRPGDAGPAVIVGHVDSRDGPAVFFRLGELRRGDRIDVGQQGGGGRSFVVDRVERRPKEALPTERIWNRTNKPLLRLITCGGGFDRSTGHYRDNIIVFAKAAS